MTYNSAIAVCQRRGSWTDALQLLNSMCHVQLLPDVAAQTKGVGGQKPAVSMWSRSYASTILFDVVGNSGISFDLLERTCHVL